MTKNSNGQFFTLPVAAALAVFATILTCTVFAGSLAPYDPDEVHLSNTLSAPSASHWFGTDQLGRDMLSRLLFGGRTAMINAVIVVFISMIGGIPLGLVCGYYAGWIDGVIMRLWEILLAFPSLLLGFLFVAMLGRGSLASVLALGIVYIPMISKLARNLTVGEKNKVYVNAAKSFGYSDFRIVFRHILPNCVSILLAELTLDLGYAIITLASLSFLGLGVQPPVSDWGAMLQEGMPLIRKSPLQALIPGFAIMLTIISLNLLSDGIQAYLDPEQRKLPSFAKYRAKQAGETR
jgi:peptide/nickel transport system permease protein